MQSTFTNWKRQINSLLVDIENCFIFRRGLSNLCSQTELLNIQKFLKPHHLDLALHFKSSISLLKFGVSALGKLVEDSLAQIACAYLAN